MISKLFHVCACPMAICGIGVYEVSMPVRGHPKHSTPFLLLWTLLRGSVSGHESKCEVNYMCVRRDVSVSGSVSYTVEREGTRVPRGGHHAKSQYKGFSVAGSTPHL